MSAIRAEVYRRANAKYPDPGVGKDVQYRNPGSGGTDEPMLITDPNTGEIYRVGGARSANQMRALKPSKIQQEQPAPKKQQPSAPKEQKMDLQRKAGDALKGLGKRVRQFDDAYSKKIGNMYEPLLVDKQGNAKVNSLVGMTIAMASQLGGGAPSSRPLGATRTEGLKGIYGALDAGLTAATNYGVPAVSAMSKYGAPALGVTLAGKGIIDLTAQFGNQADYPEPNTLTMG